MHTYRWNAKSLKQYRDGDIFVTAPDVETARHMVREDFRRICSDPDRPISVYRFYPYPDEEDFEDEYTAALTRLNEDLESEPMESVAGVFWVEGSE